MANHIKDMLDATAKALGTSGKTPPASQAQPSSLSGFKSKAPAKAAKSQATRGASAKAVKQMAKGDW